MDRRYRMKAILLVPLIALLLPCSLSGEGLERSTSLSIEAAYYFPYNEGYGVSDCGFAPISYTPVPVPPSFSSIGLDQGRALGSSWGPGKIQVLLSHTIQLPFLAGSGPLTKGNNAAFSITGALTPVSARLELTAELTPIAFLVLEAGGMAGTGWDIGLFNGMGLNADGSGVPESASLQGVVLNTWFAGTLQFDLAALVPGDWTHVVALLSPKLQYAWFSRAGREQAWMFEADNGENFNGWKFLGSYFLGYQMPLVLELTGLLLETEQNIGYVHELSPVASGGWGSDFLLLTLSPVLSFRVSEHSTLAVLFQFRRERLYTSDTVFYAFYANRKYAGTYWDFYRIAFSYSLEL